mmetsp:Transcript_208/g.547  ORF Transcript_208/g.547 Transcript_208/m.547 type:complete len:259 (-) Transcript_208:94-870(-)
MCSMGHITTDCANPAKLPQQNDLVNESCGSAAADASPPSVFSAANTAARRSTRSSQSRLLSPNELKTMALTTAAQLSGAAIPRNRLENPPKALVLSVQPGLEVCNRTLYVSKGCPTITLADPATPPAMRSWRAVATGVCAVVPAVSADALLADVEAAVDASASPACIVAESLIFVCFPIGTTSMRGRDYQVSQSILKYHQDQVPRLGANEKPNDAMVEARGWELWRCSVGERAGNKVLLSTTGSGPIGSPRPKATACQ